MSNDAKPALIHLQLREQATRQQVDTLLQISGLALTALASTRDMEGSTQRMEGEPRAAAETTFIKAFATIDSILDDKTRWNSTFQTEVEKHYRETAKANIAFLDAQAAAARYIASPSARYRPAVHKLTDGKYIAVLGDVEDLDNAIVGVGQNPQEALASFDEYFNGAIPEHVKTWLALQEKAVESGGENPEPFPKYEQETVDPSRTGKIENASHDDRQDGGANRGGA